MASTYSTSLRLELMATGDQSGTWGDTTNVNLGTLLEQAITGVLSVAEGDTTLTLTTVNGGSDQARNAVVNLTGAMTGARDVVVQTAKKLYLIKNSTTGGFVVTAKTAAGTGVEIGPGTARWVYSDGTNVIDAQTSLSLGYATTATAAGTTTLTVGSNYYQYFTGVTTQTIVLPVTSTLVLGKAFYFVNSSTGALTINSSGGNLVATVSAGSSALVQCILTSGTSAASWNATGLNTSAYLLLAGGTMTGQLVNTGSTVGYTPIQLVSTEAAAAAGPILELYRDSASPAASDILGQLIFYGRDSAANKQEYASIQSVIADPVSTTEDSTLDFYVQVAGARTLALSLTGAKPVAVVRIQTFAATGTYTPHANMVYCELNTLGAGGAGGSSNGVGSVIGGAQGGGAGSWSTLLATAATIGVSQAVTIGAAGAAAAAGLNNGGDGGDTSIAALCIGKGGKGGSGVTPATTVPSLGQGGIAGTGDITRTGAPGQYAGYVTSAAGAVGGGAGGSSPFGGGGIPGYTLSATTGVAGGAGSGKGSGGAGGFSSGNASAAGGAGTIGFAYVIEYCWK